MQTGRSASAVHKHPSIFAGLVARVRWFLAIAGRTHPHKESPGFIIGDSTAFAQSFCVPDANESMPCAAPALTR